MPVYMPFTHMLNTSVHISHTLLNMSLNNVTNIDKYVINSLNKKPFFHLFLFSFRADNWSMDILNMTQFNGLSAFGEVCSCYSNTSSSCCLIVNNTIR